MCEDGSVCQITNYYASGLPYFDQYSNKNEELQPYKYNGKEYDRMHGLNLYDYSARQYDPAIGQFTSMDPLCEKYYHISPYAYCAGNPVNRIDPDGEDIWELDKMGNVTWREKSETHQLIALDSKGKRTDNSITVSDRSILDGLTKDRKGTNANYTVTQSAEVGKVFLFAADNSNVEWSLQGFSKDGKNSYVLGTSHLEGDVNADFYGKAMMPESSLKFDVHSHPSQIVDVRGASGGDRSDGTVYGDMYQVTMRFYRFRDDYKKTLPPHCVYHRNTKVLYQYTPWESSRKIAENITPSLFNKILKIK